MVRPRPVPPNLRVMDSSAWVKGWKRRAICSAVMPMPVSVTSKRIALSCWSGSGAHSTRDGDDARRR